MCFVNMNPFDAPLEVFVPDQDSKPRKVTLWCLEELFNSGDDVSCGSRCSASRSLDIMDMALIVCEITTRLRDNYLHPNMRLHGVCLH